MHKKYYYWTMSSFHLLGVILVLNGLVKHDNTRFETDGAEPYDIIKSDDLEQITSNGRYKLSDGRIVENGMGFKKLVEKNYSYIKPSRESNSNYFVLIRSSSNIIMLKYGSILLALTGSLILIFLLNSNPPPPNKP